MDKYIDERTPPQQHPVKSEECWDSVDDTHYLITLG